MEHVFDTLQARGFVQQVTHPEVLRQRLSTERMTFYIGYDPTARSLHIGNLLTIMAMVHMQRAGHRPLVIQKNRHSIERNAHHGKNQAPLPTRGEGLVVRVLRSVD